MNEHDHPPFFGTWRKAYGSRLACSRSRSRCSTRSLCGFREPARLHRPLRDDPRDPALRALAHLRSSESSRITLKAIKTIRWGTIGLSVMATQAGPITFLSMPGQAYESGIGFIQNYFGQPFALIVVCAHFRSDLSTAESFHRLRVSRPTLRSKDPSAWRISVSDPARNRRRNHHLRAGHHSFRASWVGT